MIDMDYARKLACGITQELCSDLFSGYHTHMQARFIARLDEERISLISEGLAKLWDKLLSSCKAHEQGFTPLVSEKALACLIRRGVDKKDIRLNGFNAMVRLRNFTYYVDKEGFGCSVGPCGRKSSWSSMPMRWVTLSGEDLADFMFEFDDLVPDIVMDVDNRIQEFRIKATQYEILCQSADQLGELFLKPCGISWEVDTFFTEKNVFVTFSDGEHQPIQEQLPIISLADVFQAIPERMAAQPLIPKPKRLSWEDMLLDDSELGSIFP